VTTGDWDDRTPVEETEWWPELVVEVVCAAEHFCWVEVKMDEAERDG
jgi:hypothetical protein